MPQKLINNFIGIVTKKYFCFSGRANREEFWLYILAVLIINIILSAVGSMIKINILSHIFILATLLPTLGCSTRRLHDIGKSGWMQLLAFIPLVGIVIVLILWAKPGEDSPNKYNN